MTVLLQAEMTTDDKIDSIAEAILVGETQTEEAPVKVGVDMETDRVGLT